MGCQQQASSVPFSPGCAQSKALHLRRSLLPDGYLPLLAVAIVSKGGQIRKAVVHGAPRLCGFSGGCRSFCKPHLHTVKAPSAGSRSSLASRLLATYPRNLELHLPAMTKQPQLFTQTYTAHCTSWGWPLSLTVNHWPLATSAYRLRAGSNQHPRAEL